MQHLHYSNSAQCKPFLFKNSSDANLIDCSYCLETDKADPFAKTRILIIEDNPINQKVAKLFLENLGYDADIAASGQEALAMFNQGYSLILMDIGLPDIDGVEITQRIRAQETTSHIPIIACTASGDSYRDKCLLVGMDDFILKPLMLDELQQVLGKFLANKSIANKLQISSREQHHVTKQTNKTP